MKQLPPRDPVKLPYFTGIKNPFKVRIAIALAISFITIFAISANILMKPGVAKATTPPPNPPISNSYFVNKVTYTPGGFDPFIIVLDFGQPYQGYSVSSGAWSYGIRNWDEYYHNPTQVLSFGDVLGATEAYADGWYKVSYCWQRLTLAIGTNNSNECNGNTSCAWTEGYDLANTIDILQIYLNHKGYAWQMQVAAADDIEAEWDSYSLTMQFVGGFNAYSTREPLYDYGDANYQGSWGPSQVYQVAWGEPYDMAIPEMYYNWESADWAYLNDYSGLPYYNGVMNECNSSSVWQPWEQGCSPPPAGTYGAWWNTYNPSSYSYKGVTPSWLTNIYWANF